MHDQHVEVIRELAIHARGVEGAGTGDHQFPELLINWLEGRLPGNDVQALLPMG
ncbi:hypothetical protein D3C72_1990390 [compost metagenome]